MRRVSLPGIILLVTFGAFTALAWHDASVPLGSQYSTRAAVFGIEQYRHFLSPHMGTFVRCRFRPTCSAYGLSVVRKYGALRGGWKAITRVARCNPWTPMGTVDLP